MARLNRRMVWVLGIVLCAFLSTTTPALAAPQATEAKFTNPVAYELKSLLTTRFYCTVDTPGVWATLDIMGANGVVKRVFSGPIAQADTRTWFPYWNGLDSQGNRLPSASYDWKLTLSKGGQSSVKTGKITVSKIHFFISGAGWPDGSTSDLSVSQQYSRYMVPGNANIYLQCWETDTAVNGAGLTGDIVYTTGTPSVDYPYPQAFSYSVANDQVLKATAYLRNAKAIRYRGMHSWWLTCPNATFYITVIQ